jgi:hypothetical protein
MRSYCLTVSLGLPEQPFVAELGSSFVGVVEMAEMAVSVVGLLVGFVAKVYFG